MTAHPHIKFPTTEEAAAWISNARRELGVNQSDFAKMLDVAQSTVSRWEDGTQVPEYSTLLAIQEAVALPRNAAQVAVTLGAKLRSARVARNMKQHEVAAAMDVTVQAVSQWERDENSPTGINLLKLRALLGVEIFPESLLELGMGAHTSRSDGDRISAHETEMQELCVNTPSQIADAINLHKMLVAADERLYLDDGTPLANKAVLNTSWVREVRAFRILARMQCATAEEAQTKLAYFLKPAQAGDEYSNMEKLWLDAYVDEHDKGTGSSDLHMDFMRSLVVAGQN